MIRSKKVRESARGEKCTINGPNCDYGIETTVFCHMDEHWAGKGMGLKSHDIGLCMLSLSSRPTKQQAR